MPKIYRERETGSLVLVNFNWDVCGEKYYIINGDYFLHRIWNEKERKFEKSRQVLCHCRNLYDYVMECPIDFKGNYNHAIEVAENILKQLENSKKER